MRWTDTFVRRPVLAIVVNLVILIAGLWSVRSLSVRQYPRSDVAVVRVSTVYVGANADLVRGFITTPLERVIASADGIDYLESASAQGLSTITVHLELNYDTNAALTQVQAKVAQVRNQLPPEAEAPVIELETADSQSAAMYIGFAAERLDPNQVTDYLTRVVQPRLSSISGVQRADILGGRTFAMRVWLKPDRMAALGISPSEVSDALARNNYLSALGRTKGSMVSVNLVANTDLQTPEEFRQLVVREKDGVVVRLGELADVVLGAESYDEDVRFNGETATFMGIWTLPTATRSRSGGLTGALFREFAFTLAGAVLVSGVVALTLSPMMGSRLLRERDGHRGFAAFINGQFEMIRRAYARALSWTLADRPAVLLLWAAVVVLMVPLYLFSPKELAPQEDQGVVFGIVQSSANATLDQTKLFTAKVDEVYRSFPETASTFQITFPTGGFGGMVTKPWSERERTAQELLVQASAELAKIPGIRVIPMIPQPLPGGGDFPVDLVIASTAEPERLTEVANQLVAKAFRSGLFIFADADLKFDQPQAEVVFDRDKLRSLGVEMSQVGRDLSTMMGGNYVNRFSIEGRSYKVIPQAKRAERLSPAQLGEVHVSGPGGRLVPLSTFATLRSTTEPRELRRFQQLNAVRIQGVIPPGVPIDQALSSLENEAKAILPPGFSIDHAGESRQLREEGGQFLATFLLSAILIYLVLAAQFESFRDPFIILAGSVPLAISGALVFSFLGATTLNIYSQVGLITLVGLVSKNGILIVEFANHMQEQGRSKLQAVVEAAGTRLRPILMTTAATVVGHFPLVIATGPGAGARNSIGIMLVSGMVIGTFFTLFVVPAVYLLVAKTRAASRAAERQEAVEPAGAAA
jgi:multidrug efflux pump subunit AcrB